MIPEPVAPVPEDPPTAPTALAPKAVGRPSRRWANLMPLLVLSITGLYFVAPLLTLFRYSLQNVPAFLLGRDTLFKNWSFEAFRTFFGEDQFWSALTLSFKLAVGTAVLTLALLIPTTVWVHLKLPKARTMVEFFTVLPYMIPPIALVAGIKLIQPHVRWFLNSNYSLIPFYVVMALPFTFRSIDAGIRALDVRTLVDASRSLGCGWTQTLWRVLLPNLRTAIISASFLTMAVVFGEFTLASLLIKRTLPLFQREYTSREPQAGYALNLMVLLATTLLFVLLGVLTKKRDRKHRTFAHRAATMAPITELP